MEVDHLVIVGGPSGAGKSTLISAIMEGEIPQICQQLGIDSPSQCDYVAAINLNKLADASLDILVVHYDFYNQYSAENGFNHLDTIIDQSKSVTVLTLCVPSGILATRINQRIDEIPVPNSSHNELTRKKFLRSRRLWEERRAVYNDGNGLFSLYSKWFDFFLENRVTHHLVYDSSRFGNMKAEVLNKNMVNTFSGVEVLNTQLKHLFIE